MTNTKITFGLYDITAKEDASFSSENKASYNNLTDLNNNFLQPQNYATLEKNFWLLNGNFLTFPDNPKIEDFGFITEIDTKATITIDFSEIHSSTGISLVFDEFNNDYCTSVNIKWYNVNNNLISKKIFTPDNSEYFCKNMVENFKKIIITFSNPNNQYRRIRVHNIEFGERKIFDDDVIMEAKIIEEVEPLSSEISINTLDFKLHSTDEDFNILNPNGVYSALQQKQKIQITENKDGRDIVLGTYFLDEWKNENENTITMKAIDLIGVIDKTEFSEHVYNNTKASVIAEDISNSSGINIIIDDSLKDILLTGKIETGSHREALQQLSFALSSIADTKRQSVIYIYKPSEEIENYIIKDNKLYGTQQLTLNPIVTSVDVVGHNFSSGTDVKTVYNKTMENIPNNETPNLLKVENATLISSTNAQETANNIYDYNQNRYTTSFDFIMDNEKAGQLVKVDTMYNQKIIGYLSKLEIDLTGGYIGKGEVKYGRVDKTNN